MPQLCADLDISRVIQTIVHQVQPEHFPVGIEIDGSLRALEVLSLLDEGETGWLAALRVHPLARRKGCARRLQQYLVQLAESKLQGIKKLRYTTGSR